MIIQEIIGAINIWLNKNGVPHAARNGHAEFAAQTTGIKFNRLAPDSNAFWQEQGKAYAKMFKDGWIRVSIFAPEKSIQIDYRGSISKKQYEWLEDEAFSRKFSVVGDDGHVYIDFSGEQNESSAQSVVRCLIG